MVLLLILVLSFGVVSTGAAADPWIITTPVTVTQPTELGDVIVFGDGELRIEGVPEPGVRFSGNVIALGGGTILMENSVIRFMSTFHGQYALVADDGSLVEVRGCDYRVPSGVQHGIVTAGTGRAVLEDTDFGFVQLVPTGNSNIEARSLNGTFEVVVQEDAHIVLEDIPRDFGQGELWVWPEFPAGSTAVYSPPLPGYVGSWSFPPEGSSGIRQTIVLTRCQVRLWPLLVRENCNLTLRNITEDNWIVVGFHLPDSLSVDGLENQDPVTTQTLDFEDRTVRLDNASIDAWNLYPSGSARVEIRNCTLGEVLAFGASRVHLTNTTIDGTGGFFGSGDHSWVVAEDCSFTCDIQATGLSFMDLRRSTVAQPDYPGAVGHLGAYDTARLLLAQTVVVGSDDGGVVLSASDHGAIGLAALDPPPELAPGPAETTLLRGWIGLYSMDPELVSPSWSLSVASACGGPANEVGQGEGTVEDGELGSWSGGDPGRPYRLDLQMSDGWGRSWRASWDVAPQLIPEACAPRRGGPRPGGSR